MNLSEEQKARCHQNGRNPRIFLCFVINDPVFHQNLIAASTGIRHANNLPKIYVPDAYWSTINRSLYSNNKFHSALMGFDIVRERREEVFGKIKKITDKLTPFAVKAGEIGATFGEKFIFTSLVGFNSDLDALYEDIKYQLLLIDGIENLLYLDGIEHGIFIALTWTLIEKSSWENIKVDGIEYVTELILFELPSAGCEYIASRRLQTSSNREKTLEQKMSDLQFLQPPEDFKIIKKFSVGDVVTKFINALYDLTTEEAEEVKRIIIQKTNEDNEVLER